MTTVESERIQNLRNKLQKLLDRFYPNPVRVRQRPHHIQVTEGNFRIAKVTPIEAGAGVVCRVDVLPSSNGKWITKNSKGMGKLRPLCTEDPHQALITFCLYIIGKEISRYFAAKESTEVGTGGDRPTVEPTGREPVQ